MASGQPGPNLRVNLFGGFAVSYQGVPVTALRAPRLQLLLSYLLLHRQAPQRRQHLAFLLWPDSNEAQAHTNLRNVIHLLRRSLPESEQFLRVDALTVQWNTDVLMFLDVAEFERAEAAGDDELAVAQYQGPLLPGLYEEWVIAERARLDQAYVEALGRLVQQYREAGSFPTAIRYAERLVQHDPLREVSARDLMRLHVLNGDRAAAMRAYHTCAAALQNDLGVNPGAATQAAYRQVLALPDTGAAQPRTLPSPALIGRTNEWMLLSQAWQHAVDVGPRLVVVTGEAGVGKTRLAGELTAWLTRQGIRVAWAGCYETEGKLPFAPVIAWLRSHPLPHLNPIWLAEVARLLPEVAAAHPGLRLPGPLAESWQRQRFFEALAHGLLDGPQPLLLVLEDLQWCDQDTLEWLHFLLRCDSSAGLMVLGTCRCDEMPATDPSAVLIQALRTSNQVSELVLPPLDRRGTAELAGQLLGGPLAPPAAEQIYRATAGNPLYIVESVRSGLIDTWAGESRSGLVIPPALQSVLGARLAPLSPAGRDLLGLAATFGREFTFPALCAASPLPEEEVVHALDELWRRRLVLEQGARSYILSHDLLRQLIYLRLPPATRRWHHRRIAEALISIHKDVLDAVSGQIAYHYEQAGLAEQSVPYYIAAAEGARRTYANEQAIEAYGRGLAVLATLPCGEAVRQMIESLAEAQGDVLVLVARHDTAIEAFTRALAARPNFAPGDAPAAVTRGRLLRKVASEQAAATRLAEAAETYGQAEAALAALPEPWPESAWQEWIEIHLGRAWLSYWQDDIPELRAVVNRLRPAVESHGTPVQRATFLHSLIELNQRRERYQISAETLGYARALYAITRQHGSPEQLGTAELVLGLSLLWYGDLDSGAGHLHAAQEASVATGDSRLKTRSLVYLGLLHRLRGEVAEAAVLSQEGLAAATAGQWGTLAGLAHGNLAWVALRNHELDRAEESAESARALWGVQPYPFRWTALFPLIAVRLARDDSARAIVHVRTLLEPGQQRLPDSLAAALQTAIVAWENSQPEETMARLGEALQIARAGGYA